MPLHSTPLKIATTNRFELLAALEEKQTPKKKKRSKRRPAAMESASQREDAFQLSRGASASEGPSLLDVFRDPVSFEIFQYPHVTPCGHTFGADSLVYQWSYTRTDAIRCAMCRTPFSLLGVHPNFALRDAMTSLDIPWDERKDADTALRREVEKEDMRLRVEKIDKYIQSWRGSVAAAFGCLMFMALLVPSFQKDCSASP